MHVLLRSLPPSLQCLHFSFFLLLFSLSSLHSHTLCSISFISLFSLKKYSAPFSVPFLLPPSSGASASWSDMEAAAAADDMADGMQCSDHPYRTNPHGICPLCLQEKLGKLLSSSLPLPLRPSSSSSPPSPSSFRSDLLPPPSSSTSRPSSSSLSLPQSQPNNGYHHHSHRPRILFLSAKKKHKKKPSVTPSSSSSSAAVASSSDVFFKRSKSTATPRRGKLLDDPGDSPRKRNGFWSFLHLSSKSSSSSASGKKSEAKGFRDGNNSPSGKQKQKCEGSSSLGGRKIDIVVEDDETCNSRQTSASSFERKVSRSRSVGCGSRSFSGDFFERISTGFGDCALRRVESQREGKPKVARGGDHHHSIKERARCGGLFSGFMINSSSSSSSSSSYLVSSSNDDQSTGRKSESMALSQSRGRYWGWAFASPMRVFTTNKPSNSKDIKNNATPNLSAIPSLLAVKS